MVLIALILDQLKNREPLLNLGKNDFENAALGPTRLDPTRPEANTLENYRSGHVFRPGRRLKPWETFGLVTFFGPTRPEANTFENYRFGHVFRPGPAGE